ncbi:MAG: hypothetical protein WDZ93_00335 [Candidatus Paceibacterota bacterium]
MSFIDMIDFRRACAICPKVDPDEFKAAILGVYEKWSADKEAGVKPDFHKYFGLTILELGIEYMFEFREYQFALTAYFQPRAVRKRKQQRGIRIPLPKNPVEHPATYNRVRIRIDRTVSIEFSGPAHRRTIRLPAVIEAYKIWHGPKHEIDDDVLHSARTRALAVMNSKRNVA